MKNQILHTIGYEGISIEMFLSMLAHAGIDLLIDVRDVPISRKKGFSKNKLAEALNECGVEYLHLKGLGDPKLGRIAAREDRIDDFRRIFKSHMQSSVAKVDLERGIDAARNRFACLMCFEKEHQYCHRCIVAESMAIRGGFKLIHIRPYVAYSSNQKTGRKSTQHGIRAHIG